MLGSFKFICKTKKFKNKIYLIQTAKSIIDDKLDIVFYIRNMILFEVINKINLENMDIINFLSRPIIYLKKEKEKSEFNLDDIKITNSVKIPNISQEKKIEENKIEENIEPKVEEINSKDDKLADFEKVEPWISAIKNCTFVPLENGGHMMDGNSDLVEHAVCDFIEANK